MDSDDNGCCLGVGAGVADYDGRNRWEDMHVCRGIRAALYHLMRTMVKRVLRGKIVKLPGIGRWSAVIGRRSDKLGRDLRDILGHGLLIGDC